MRPTKLKHLAPDMHLSTDSPVYVKGVSVDSRITKPGDIFFALSGAKVNGHDFLRDAASKGAVAAVVSKSYLGPDFGLVLLRSDDCLLALQDLAKAFVQRSRAKVVGVTGSVGKTTSKEFISTLLQTQYRVLTSSGNSNSQIGLPLTLLNHASLDADIIVQEMGMTESGQISKLVNIIPPHVAVVTTVALVHAENFHSIDDIARAKAEIFSHPTTQMGLYHKDANYSDILRSTGTCLKHSFSITNESSDYYLQEIDNQLKIRDPSGQSMVLPSLNMPGKHNVQNFLIAVAVARYFNVLWEKIIDAVPLLSLPERRLQYIEKMGAIFVNDSYNAAEISTKAALSALPSPKPGGKKIAVFGGMVELGKFSKECHKAVAEHALGCVDMMFCFGEDCRVVKECWDNAGQPVVWEMSRVDLVDALRKAVQPGDVVLLKGSRLKETWKFLDEL